MRNVKLSLKLIASFKMFKPLKSFSDMYSLYLILVSVQVSSIYSYHSLHVHFDNGMYVVYAW